MIELDQKTSQGTILKASGSWTVDRAPEIWRSLLSHRNGNVAVDMQEVDRMDSAGLQILLKFKKMAAEEGKVFKILNHSPSVLKLLDLSGALGSLKDQVRITSSTKGMLDLTYSRNRYEIYGK